MRRSIPRLIKAKILLHQEGRCGDCGTRLILGSLVFDHRPPLALRDPADDANDPDRLVAICSACDKQKTLKDLHIIAKTKRLAVEYNDFIERQREKVPGRRNANRRERLKMDRLISKWTKG